MRCSAVSPKIRLAYASGKCGAPLLNRCPKCGFESPPAFDFCGRCGSPAPSFRRFLVRGRGFGVGFLSSRLSRPFIGLFVFVHCHYALPFMLPVCKVPLPFEKVKMTGWPRLVLVCSTVSYSVGLALFARAARTRKPFQCCCPRRPRWCRATRDAS